ncbi:hypothetical protein QJQ45_023017, partial [Haematococcus lacustris]
ARAAPPRFALYSDSAELSSIRGTLLGGNAATKPCNQRSALPTTPQPRGQPCKSMSSSQVQPGAAANKQPRGTAKMCSKEAHLGAAAISHTAQLPRWRMTHEQQPSAARSSGQQTAKGNSQDVQQGGSSRSRRHKSYGAAT